MLFLDDAALERLSRETELVRQFPFLGVQAKPVKKAWCGRKATPQDPARMPANTILQHVAGLPKAEKLRFKKLAGADKVRFSYRTSAGRHMTHTF